MLCQGRCHRKEDALQLHRSRRSRAGEEVLRGACRARQGRSSRAAAPAGRVQAQDRPVAHLQAWRCAEGDHAAGRPAGGACASGDSGPAAAATPLRPSLLRPPFRPSRRPPPASPLLRWPAVASRGRRAVKAGSAIYYAAVGARPPSAPSLFRPSRRAAPPPARTPMRRRTWSKPAKPVIEAGCV